MPHSVLSSVLAFLLPHYHSIRVRLLSCFVLFLGPTIPLLIVSHFSCVSLVNKTFVLCDVPDDWRTSVKWN